MRIGGGLGAHPALVAALTAARDRVSRAVRAPSGSAFAGMAVITPLMLAAAVGASGPGLTDRTPAVDDTAVTPLVAVAPTPKDTSGPTVVAVARPPASFHIAASTSSAPPPSVVVSSPGALRIPAIALSAYRNAESMMSRAYPNCGVSWNLLAGIGRIESMHANGGATDSRGTAVNPIYGPALDGTLPGNEVIVQAAQANGRVTYARAMGPMQFLPGTWSRYASDGDGDGKADPQNVYDATLAAARYLCSGNLNLRDSSQVMTAILRYNNSVAYARNVMGWAASYATGVAPVNLPPISGPIPAISDAHLDHPEGLGPDLPLNAAGLPSSDPLAQVPSMRLSQTDVANQLPVPPGPAAALGNGDAAPASPCAVFCISNNPPPAAPAPVPPPWTPPWLLPPPPIAPAPAPLVPPLAPLAPPPLLAEAVIPEPAVAPPAPAGPLGPAPGPLGPAPGPVA